MLQKYLDFRLGLHWYFWHWWWSLIVRFEGLSTSFPLLFEMLIGHELYWYRGQAKRKEFNLIPTIAFFSVIRIEHHGVLRLVWLWIWPIIVGLIQVQISNEPFWSHTLSPKKKENMDSKFGLHPWCQILFLSTCKLTWLHNTHRIWHVVCLMTWMFKDSFKKANKVIRSELSRTWQSGRY